MLHKKSLWRGLTFVFALLLCIAITAGIILEQFAPNVDSLVEGTHSSLLVSDDDGDLYSVYAPNDDYLNSDGTGNSTAIIKAAIELGEQEGAEGTVLLKNNGILPLESSAASKKNVTLLGLRSHMPELGAGMGVAVQGPVITLEDALSRTTTDWTNSAKWTTGSVDSTMDEFTFTGANYNLNPDAIKYYDDFNASAKYSYNDSVTTKIQEASKSELESALGTCSGYTDAVIVVVGRNSSEASDYKPGTVTKDLGNSEPLELTTNEKETIEYAKSVTNGNGHVILLLNTCNNIEIDDYKNDDGIGAILNISFPGAYGMLGVADVLCGNVSPSGALADIAAAKNMSAPAMQNMGSYTFSNADAITRGENSKYYVIEAENIYTGYRYYETRYNDVVEGRGNAASSAGAYAGESGWDYGKEVSYGFGYGLSYTEFTQEITKTEVEQSSHSITIDFTVKVTNTGDAAGKSIVQIYGQAPYISGGLEKTAIELLAFGKTKTLDPKEDQELTITVDLQNLASYDSTLKRSEEGDGGYVLDAGNYYFALGNGAHDALNNVLVEKDSSNASKIDDSTKTADSVSGLVYEWAFTPASGGDQDVDTFSVSKNNTTITNQIPYADFNYYQPGTVTYLSRSAWDTTYPTSYTDITAPDSMMDDLNGNYYTVKTDEDTSSFKWGQSGDLKFYQMTGAEWDDYRWDDLLSQMTINESMWMAGFGGPNIPTADSIGFIEISMTENNGNGIVYSFGQNLDPAAPWSIAAGEKNSGWNGQVFGGSPLLAATFNPEIALRMGEFIGNESLFLGVPIIWGPGLNTHRDAYNGRNAEYYSEDPVLSGVVAEYFSYGCAEYGLVAAPKHFAFNDQETNRAGIAPFMTEQRAREVELRAYQISIECPDLDKITELAQAPNESYTGMFGLMTSFSKIGAVECTCSRGLLTGILKEEWGFHGYAVTDIYDDTTLYSAAVYAGITGFDMRGSSGFDTTKALGSAGTFADGTQVDGLSLNSLTYSGDASMMQALKDSNKNLLWAIAQSNLMNRYSSSTHKEWNMTWWRGVYFAAIAVFAVLTAAGAALYVVSIVLKKKGSGTNDLSKE